MYTLDKNDMWKVGCFYGTGKQLIESGDIHRYHVELVEKQNKLLNKGGD